MNNIKYNLIKARIEDVVVDSEARGKGICKALLFHGLAEVSVTGTFYRFMILIIDFISFLMLKTSQNKIFKLIFDHNLGQEVWCLHCGPDFEA